MQTMESVMLLGLALIVLTALAVISTDVVDFVDKNVRLLLGS